MASTVRSRLVALLLVPLAALVLGACGSGEPPAAIGAGGPVTAPSSLSASTDDHPRVDSPHDAPAAASTSITARLLSPTDAIAAPESDADVVASLDETTELGSATTLLVVDQHEDWLEVALPVRPNGSTGWIPADAAELRSTTYAIEVDLAGRTLTLLDNGAPVIETPVAIGSGTNPTPPGTYFVTDLVDTGDAEGAYGPFAFGLSGHSETLTEFAGGDGQLGIHGTNDPSSIGRSVSHGCVRVPNETIAQMVDLVPLGTPVTVA